MAAMPLDDLLRLVETLRARIDAHGQALRGSEALTRYALIDPLLRELGWDTSDPTQVVPEYTSAGGRADYALLSEDGRPQIIIEAKSLGTPPQSAVQQVINYCTYDGYDHFAVTDGARWELYETHKPGNWQEKRTIYFDILSSPAKACLDALALWRPSVLAGTGPPSGENRGDDYRARAQPAPPHPTPPQPIPTIIPTGAAEGGWLSLATLMPEGGSKPAEIQFPTGERVAATAWADFMAALVRWLENAGHLSQADAPIQYGKMNILATSPNHPNGQAFRHRRQTRLFHINTNYSGSDSARNARLIIERAKLDPAQFRVRLRD